MIELGPNSDSDAEELAKPDAVDPAAVRLAAVNLLARREYSRRELQQKLIRRFKHSELIEEVLERLEQERLQSDTRYVESLLRRRIGRGQGPVRIRQEMRQKGIPDSEINAAIEAEAPDWYAIAEETYRRKFGELPPQDRKEKARRGRFMQYRGFVVEHFQHLLG